jgi:hypothetical protein
MFETLSRRSHAIIRTGFLDERRADASKQRDVVGYHSSNAAPPAVTRAFMYCNDRHMQHIPGPSLLFGTRQPLPKVLAPSHKRPRAIPSFLCALCLQQAPDYYAALCPTWYEAVTTPQPCLCNPMKRRTCWTLSTIFDRMESIDTSTCPRSSYAASSLPGKVQSLKRFQASGSQARTTCAPDLPQS